MKDPERWEDLGNGLHLLREDVPLTADEKARFYGKGELKRFTRRPPEREDPRPPASP